MPSLPGRKVISGPRDKRLDFAPERSVSVVVGEAGDTHKSRFRARPAPSGLAPVGGAGSARARIQEAKMTARSNRKTPTKPATTAGKARTSARTMKPPTKRARLIGLLKAAGGADVVTLSAALGWQQHSTRAALTGLRKAGFTIERTTPEGARTATYRITVEPKEVLAR